MAYEPKTVAGKEALEAGADPEVIEEQEKSGELIDEKNPEEHVDKKPDNPEDESANKKQEEKSDKEGDGEGKEEDEVVTPDRTPEHMPVWKAKEIAKQEAKEAADAARAEAKAEYDAELAKMGGKQGGPSSDDVTKVAEELGLSEETAKALIERTTEIVSKRLGIDEIRKTQADSQEQAKAVAEEKSYEKEWASKDTQDALAAAASGRQITPEVQKKVRELAYTTTYAKYRIADIVNLNKATLFPAAPTEKRSAEIGKGGAGHGQAPPKSLDDVSSDELNSMTDEEFDAFSNQIGGKGTRFTRITKPKK